MKENEYEGLEALFGPSTTTSAPAFRNLFLDRWRAKRDKKNVLGIKITHHDRTHVFYIKNYLLEKEYVEA